VCYRKFLKCTMHLKICTEYLICLRPMFSFFMTTWGHIRQVLELIRIGRDSPPTIQSWQQSTGFLSVSRVEETTAKLMFQKDWENVFRSDLSYLKYQQWGPADRCGGIGRQASSRMLITMKECKYILLKKLYFWNKGKCALFFLKLIAYIWPV
jgi:hypothetical protein